MKRIELRAADVADLVYLADVCESVRPLYDPLMPGAFKRQAERFRSAQELPSNYMVMVILEEGERVGFVELQSICTDLLYLVALYIHANHHRNGIGGAVLERICTDAVKDGYRQIVLLAHERAVWAIQFYELHGFTILVTGREMGSEYDDRFTKEMAKPHTVLMRRDL